MTRLSSLLQSVETVLLREGQEHLCVAIGVSYRLRGNDSASTLAITTLRTNLKAVCYTLCAFMMEYQLYFTFGPIGDDSRVNCLIRWPVPCTSHSHGIQLRGFWEAGCLRYLCCRKGCPWSCIPPCKWSCSRWSKACHTLASNQHYRSAGKDEIGFHFNSRPVVCKLTDFGESHSTYFQTNTVLVSKTARVDRGTADSILAPWSTCSRWRQRPGTYSSTDVIRH